MSELADLLVYALGDAFTIELLLLVSFVILLELRDFRR